MFGQSQTKFLSSYVSTYEHPLTSAQRKLDDLVERIETCKQALKITSLSSTQSLMARQLVSSLDQGVDELATQICSRLAEPIESEYGGSTFNDQIERLLLICMQLSAALLSQTSCPLA